MFRGVYTALVTPFTQKGELDENALRRLVDQQIEVGVQGLVPVGTTGESPTVSHDENIRVIEVVVEQNAGRVPVVAGTGSNSTIEAIQLTARAKKLGANACLQVVPYYNRPNQEGLYQHFASIAEAVDLPIILYNHPGRTGRNLEPETVLRLAKHKNIAAIKEASGNLPQMMEIIALAPVGFSILSGDDNLTLPLMACGGHGVISVASHIAGADMVALCKAIEEGHMDEARRLHYQLMPLCKALNIDTNPIPVKYALSKLGLIEEMYRLPLTPLTDKQKAEVDAAMQAYGLIK